MKYSFKDYLIDTLMFGLSVSITPIIYLSTFIIVNKFDYINTPVYLYLAIFISFLLPFIFGIFLSRKLCKQSISSYLTVFLIMEIIFIFHIKIPDSYFVFLLPQEEWIRGLFNKSDVFSPSTACKPMAVCHASLFSALSGSPCFIYSSSSNCQFLSGIFAPPKSINKVFKY